MYAAEFELEGQAWAVFAGRPAEGARGLVPAGMQSALLDGGVPRWALRCRFDAAGVRATLLVPTTPGDAAQALRDALAPHRDLQWADDAGTFDTLGEGLGECRAWLDTGSFSVGDVPCPTAASFLPDWPAWRVFAVHSPFTWQINVVHAPAGVDEQRALRKHLARVQLLAAEGAWPARVPDQQRRLVEARVASPWRADELLAADDADTLARLQRDLRERLGARARQVGAGVACRMGRFDELWLTGLDSSCFVSTGAVAAASRAIDPSRLRALLAEPADARTEASACADGIDVFISHASADADLAGRLCARIEETGLRCWIAPRDIPPGSSYAERIALALRQSRALLLLMSPAALVSTHVERELERAVSLRRSVLPLRLADVQPRGAFEYLLSGCQWTDCPPGADERLVIQRLTQGLRAAG